MNKIDDLYELAQRDYEARQARRKFKVVGSRDDMDTVRDWWSYCMSFKPITYGAYLGMLVAQANQDIPHFQPIWRHDLPE